MSLRIKDYDDMATQEEMQEIVRMATEFYFLRDVAKALDVPNREHLHNAVFSAFEKLGTDIQAHGATIETRPAAHPFDSPLPIVVLSNGFPVGSTHNRLDIEQRVTALIEADTPR